jgi:hypothetical protein
VGKENGASNKAGDSGSIHLSLQGKGGVGKSFAASVLAQYFQARDKPLRCIDTDPVNKTLTQFEALHVEPLVLLSEGRIDQGAFDVLIDKLVKGSETFVVDNGASTFIPLWHYMLESNAIEVLTNAGRTLYVHTVVTGGQALSDTLKGFGQIAETTSSRNVVVWINEFFGRVQYEGKSFADLKVFKDNAHKVHGSVALPRRNPDTFGRDIDAVISRKLTFEEAIQDAAFSIMTRQRLKMVQREMFEQLDTVFQVNRQVALVCQTPNG